jgi:hypothetical protein
MRPALPIIGLLLLFPSATPAGDPEAILKESLKLTSDMAETLKAVKDKTSAEAAVPKLKALDERLAALQKKEAQVRKLSADEQKELQTKYKAAVTTAHKALGRELERVAKLPDVKALLLKESALLKQGFAAAEQFASVGVSLAKIQIGAIDRALRAYHVRNGEFPADLKALTQGDGPYLKAEALTDPWKKPYQYDRAGPSNKGKRPDVWTSTPDQKVIGNWKEEKSSIGDQGDIQGSLSNVARMAEECHDPKLRQR